MEIGRAEGLRLLPRLVDYFTTVIMILILCGERRDGDSRRTIRKQWPSGIEPAIWRDLIRINPQLQHRRSFSGARALEGGRERARGFDAFRIGPE